VLPKDYAHPRLDKQRLGQLIDLIGNIGLGDKENRSKDILGRVYEYFLSQFASAEGKKGGQFDTARCVVRLLVEMLAPYKGRRRGRLRPQLLDLCRLAVHGFPQGADLVLQRPHLPLHVPAAAAEEHDDQSDQDE
jgi:type I restriction-modification system DNA methylase subunit